MPVSESVNTGEVSLVLGRSEPSPRVLEYFKTIVYTVVVVTRIIMEEGYTIAPQELGNPHLQCA